MTHVVAHDTPPPPSRTRSKAPRHARRLVLALACGGGLLLNSQATTAATRHLLRPHDEASTSAGQHANPNPSVAGATKGTPIWRCTDPLGGTRYSQQACQGGTALTHLADPRTPAQRAQAADMQER